MEIAAPEHVGLSSARLARIDAAMQRYIEQGQFAGLVTLVARRGRIAHYAAYGWADIESKRPMRPDDLVCLWSMSKPVTAVAALALYEEGRFLLDDPISRFLPAFAEMRVAVPQPDGSLRLEPAEREITFRHLLTHTSGLGYGGRAPSPGDPFTTLYYESGVWQAETLEEFARRLATAPLAFTPGTAWLYGANFELLGALIEKIAGMPFAAFMQERLFGPLGMEDTGFTIPAAQVHRLATTYTRDAPSAQGAPALARARPGPRARRGLSAQHASVSL